MGPANHDHEAASRCAVSVFVPLMVVLLMDRIDLAIFVSFGAFTSIYGRNLLHADRLRMQLRAGGMMLVVLTLGTLGGRAGFTEAEMPRALVAATALVAGICSVLAGLWQMRPAGSLFQIFGFAAVASVPTQPPLLDALVATVLSIGFSLAVGLSSRMFSAKARTPLSRPTLAPLTRLQKQVVWVEGSWYVIAAGLAGSLATLLGPALGMQHSQWAMALLSTVLATSAGATHVDYGQLLYDRALETIIGALVGMACVMTPWAWRKWAKKSADPAVVQREP
ncbi:FUSC family protein [Micrococcus sp. IITD107]|uniref:FUSC family protein n=1 Tax=Micrococcus sp. IITD107 TaxID=3342790 RepID=UPI0035B824C3